MSERRQRIFNSLMEEAKQGKADVVWAAREFLRKVPKLGVSLPDSKPSIPRKWVEAAWKKQRGRCAECGEELQIFDSERDDYATGDHIEPWSKGGPHKSWNIRAVSKRCNSEKGAREPLTHSRKTGKTLVEIFGEEND